MNEPETRIQEKSSKPEPGQTRVFGIFGYPIAHTLSPPMQNAAFKAYDLNSVYIPFEIDPAFLKNAVTSILPLGIKGVNITIPHKETIIPFLDSLDEEARKIGAVNTIEVSSGRLIGHNTDGKGYLASVAALDIDLRGQRVLMIGAGGAAKGVAVAVLSSGISELILMVRRLDRGKALVKQLSALFPDVPILVVEMNSERRTFQKKDRATLLINCTPLGMKEEDPTPFPLPWIEAHWIVSDLVYRPTETPLLSAAKKVGALTVPGIGMLLHQGALAFEIWTREKAPLSIMKDALEEALSPPDTQ
ncbi:MAG: shikimate dehydrogenase [Nitrospira sp.]|nr:shikimate dehydrogenase [Candidatus Manganitrophaceae bacterium]HIL35660.1 shikimate dehydrogenase [Candidatus Manganitrophaceae bacterium]